MAVGEDMLDDAVITKHEVRATHHPYDMSGWLAEKSERTAAMAGRLAETIRSEQAIPEGTRQLMEFMLHSMLHNITKVMAFACGGPWSTSDADLIFDRGEKGFEEVCVRYGILAETTEQRERRRMIRLVHELEDLLTGGRYLARTLIYDRLVAVQRDHPELCALEDLTERLTQGYLTWDDYCERAQAHIRFLKLELGTTDGESPAPNSD